MYFFTFCDQFLLQNFFPLGQLHIPQPVVGSHRDTTKIFKSCVEKKNRKSTTKSKGKKDNSMKPMLINQ